MSCYKKANIQKVPIQLYTVINIGQLDKTSIDRKKYRVQEEGELETRLQNGNDSRQTLSKNFTMNVRLFNRYMGKELDF